MKQESPAFKSRSIYQDLLQQINDGTLPPNSKLPSITDLATQYGVAKMTLRQALSQLAREGLLKSRPYHGTWICDPASRGQTKTVGLVVPFSLSNLTHPVFNRMVQGIESAVSEEGYTLILEVSDPSNPRQEEALHARLKKRDAGGWIISVALSAETQSILESLQAPAVLFHYPMPEVSNHLFLIDEAALWRDIMNHAVEQGYQSPCLVYSSYWDQHQFLKRYQQYSEEHGQPKAAIQLFSDELFGKELGAKAARAMLDLPQQPDLFICDDDDVAFGVMQVLSEKGIRAPEIGIIGAGDFPASELVNPPLTTTHLPYRQLGREAARLLIDILNGLPSEAMTRKFSAELLIRASSSRKK